MLPENPTWTEDPLDDQNWSFRYHSLTTTVGPLLAAGATTGDRRYLDRAAFLLADWVADNPRDAPPAPMSWNDHSTALRAIMIACALQILPHDPWLLDAAEAHAATLSDPTFYVNDGNHAINQARGLLSLGCVLDRPEWKALAATRLGTLVPWRSTPTASRTSRGSATGATTSRSSRRPRPSSWRAGSRSRPSSSASSSWTSRWRWRPCPTASTRPSATRCAEGRA